MRSETELTANSVAVGEAVRGAHAFGEGDLKVYHAHVFNLTGMRERSQWPEVRLIAAFALKHLQSLHDDAAHEAVEGDPLTSEPDDGAPPWHCGDTEIADEYGNEDGKKGGEG